MKLIYRRYQKIKQHQTKSEKITATVKNRFRSFFVISKPKVCNEMK